MEVSTAIRLKLEELAMEQKDLAAAASVTDSYISQLLAGKKLPPAPERTDIYEKMEGFLRLRSGQLAKLAAIQRREELKKQLGETSAPLFKEVRELILRKCAPDVEKHVRTIFEKQPFGELERLVTQKLLDVAKNVAREELDNENWMRLVARLSGRSYEEMRVMILDFLDTDILNLSPENCISFLDPLIGSWKIDLTSFSLEIILSRRIAPGYPKKFQFVEREADQARQEEPGLREFLREPSLCGDASEEEIEFLRSLKFKRMRPTALYFYRELQNLRDPLHFVAAQDATLSREMVQRRQREGSVAPMHKYRDAEGIEKQLQLDGRRKALQRWNQNKGGRNQKRKAKS
jgi:transcriptional regulator with XRE-family HTH domain